MQIWEVALMTKPPLRPSSSYIGGNLSKRQKMVEGSSLEAKYMFVTNTAVEVVYYCIYSTS